MKFNFRRSDTNSFRSQPHIAKPSLFDDGCLGTSNQSFDTSSIWEDEDFHGPRRCINKGRISIDPNMPEREKFALEWLLGETISELPAESKILKGQGYTEAEQFALEFLLGPKPKKQHSYGRWLKQCWREIRSTKGKRSSC